MLLILRQNRRHSALNMEIQILDADVYWLDDWLKKVSRLSKFDPETGTLIRITSKPVLGTRAKSIQPRQHCCGISKIEAC